MVLSTSMSLMSTADAASVAPRRLLIQKGGLSPEFTRRSVPREWYEDGHVDVLSTPETSDKLPAKLAFAKRWMRENLTDATESRVFMISCDGSIVFLAALRDSLMQTGETDLLPMLDAYQMGPILICKQKVVARQQVPALGGIRFAGCRSDDRVIPSVGDGVDKVIYKPLDGVSSKGIVVTRPGADAPPVQSFFEMDTERMFKQYLPSVEVDFSNVAIIEEYVPPHVRKIAVAGFVCSNGRPVVWAVVDNVYCENNPEAFDYIGIPSTMTPEQKDACKAKFLELASTYQDKFGARNQFFEAEMFVWDSPLRVEVMEVNGRAGLNYQPVWEQSTGMSAAGVLERIRAVTPDTTEFEYPVPQDCGASVTLYLDFDLPSELKYDSEDFPNAFATGGVYPHVFGTGESRAAALEAARGLQAALRATAALQAADERSPTASDASTAASPASIAAAPAA